MEELFGRAKNAVRFEHLPLETQKMISLLYMEPSEVEYFAAKVDITKVLDQILPIFDEKLVGERTILQKVFRGIEIAQRVQSCKVKQQMAAITKAGREINKEFEESLKTSEELYYECFGEDTPNVLTEEHEIKMDKPEATEKLWDPVNLMMELPFYNLSLDDEEMNTDEDLLSSRKQYVAKNMGAQKPERLPKRKRSQIAFSHGCVPLADCWVQAEYSWPPRMDDAMPSRTLYNQRTYYITTECFKAPRR